MKKQKITALVMGVALAAASILTAHAEPIETAGMSETFLETEESIQTEAETEETEVEDMESQMPKETNESQETAEMIEQTDDLEEE